MSVENLTQESSISRGRSKERVVPRKRKNIVKKKNRKLNSTNAAKADDNL